MINQLMAEWQKIYSTKKFQIYQDLIHEDFWRDHIDYMMNDRYHINNMDADEIKDAEEEIFWDFIHSRFEDWMDEFNFKAREQNGKLKVFRCLAVNDADEFTFNVANGLPAEGYEGLGIYWAWNEDKADCHWGKGGSKQIMVHGLVPYESIDPYMTLILNLNPTLGSDEAEIRLHEGAKVDVLGVDIDNEFISPLDEGHEPIPMAANYPTLAKILANEGAETPQMTMPKLEDEEGEVVKIETDPIEEELSEWEGDDWAFLIEELTGEETTYLGDSKYEHAGEELDDEQALKLIKESLAGEINEVLSAFPTLAKLLG